MLISKKINDHIYLQKEIGSWNFDLVNQIYGNINLDYNLFNDKLRYYYLTGQFILLLEICIQKKYQFYVISWIGEMFDNVIALDKFIVLLKDIINKPQSDYLLQNFLEIDSGSKVNFYLNYLLENNGSIELDRIYPIYASVI
ncbi:capsular biosynthesis protein, partial [Campylobacter jejuni]|nr:capsular biosynthesis protein [Campylobacter jejuni]